jgi:peptide/nickel transport system permease protein
MRTVDFVVAFPFMVLVIVVITIFGPGLTGVYVGLIIKSFPSYVRVTRAEMLVLREQQFILAAHAGLLDTTHPGPPCASAPAAPEPQLLDPGVQPPQAEWGVIISEDQTYLLNAWWIATLPGAFVVVFGISMSLTGEGLAERPPLPIGGLP